MATLVAGVWCAASAWFFWPLAVPAVVLWLWVLWFFRNPARRRSFATGELCGPADGTVTEVSDLADHPAIPGPVVRIGMFLSLFDVHANRAPCAGTVRRVTYRPGEFLDARHPESGKRNESNTLLIDPNPPMPGPIEVRQVAGLVARRIVCHAREGTHVAIGERFGMIKFGSRTELIIPRLEDTEILVRVGDKVHAGLTIVARQPVPAVHPDTAPSAMAVGA